MNNNICSERNIILYIEGELPEVEMLKMEAHFAHCKHCQRLLEQHRLIRLGLKWDTQITIPDNFADMVMEKLPTPFENFLSSAREKIIATGAFIVFFFLGLLSYIIGTNTSNIEDLISVKWWDKTILGLFSGLTYAFKTTLQVVKTIITIGLFFLKETDFVLGIIGKVLIRSHQIHVALLLSITLLLFSTYYSIWKQNSKLNKARIMRK